MIAIPLSSERGVPGGEERGEMDVFAGYLSLGQHAKLILPVMGYVARFLAAVYGEQCCVTAQAMALKETEPGWNITDC